MTPAAVAVLVAGLVVVAAIVAVALVGQRRRERTATPRARPPAPARARREEPPTDPITTRTAQADPATVTHPTPLFGEGERHPTPPASGGNGRSPGDHPPT